MGIDEGLTGRRPGIRSSGVGCRAGNPKSGLQVIRYPASGPVSARRVRYPGVRSGIVAAGKPAIGVQVRGVRSVRSGRGIRYRGRSGNPVPGVQVSLVSGASGQSGIGAIRSGKAGQSGIGGGGYRRRRPTRYRASRSARARGVRSVRSGRPDIPYRALPGNPVPGVQVSRASEAPGQSGIGAIRYGKSGQSGSGRPDIGYRRPPGNPILGRPGQPGIGGVRSVRYRGYWAIGYWASDVTYSGTFQYWNRAAGIRVRDVRSVRYGASDIRTAGRPGIGIGEPGVRDRERPRRFGIGAIGYSLSGRPGDLVFGRPGQSGIGRSGSPVSGRPAIRYRALR
jgi:hypothetical protein